MAWVLLAGCVFVKLDGNALLMNRIEAFCTDSKGLTPQQSLRMGFATYVIAYNVQSVKT